MTIKWSAFSAGSAISASNEFVGLQGSTNVRWTFTQLTTFLSTGGGATFTGFDFTGGATLQGSTANVLEQRNGGNAQTSRIYNTFTDASNYRRIDIAPHQIVANAAGTGAGWSTGLDIGGAVGTTGPIRFYTSNTGRWTIDGAAGHLLAFADNTYDIGALGATRPRNIYAGGTLATGVGTKTIPAWTGGDADSGFFWRNGGTDIAYSRNNVGMFSFDTSAFILSSNITLSWSSGEVGIDGGDLSLARAGAGILTLSNASGDFSRLQFGGTTSSFPALKRSSTVLQARLADDSGFAPLQGMLRSNANATAETPTATHTLRIFDAAGVEYRVLAIAV